MKGKPDTMEKRQSRTGRFFTGLLLLFIATGLFAASGPCPVSPGALTLGENGIIYLGASHPWYGADTGAILSLNPSDGETLGYRYPMLVTANTATDPFRPVSICFSKKTGRIYAAYRREGPDDGFLVMDPPSSISTKSTPAGKKEAGWGRIAAIGLSQDDSGLLVLHTVVENLTLTADHSGTRLQAELHFRLTALPLDDRGYPVRSLASIQWSMDETVDELRPGAVGESDAGEWLTTHRLIRVGCVQPDGSAYLIIGDKLSRLNATDNHMQTLSTGDLNRVAELTDAGDSTVFMLQDKGSSTEIIHLNTDGTTKETLDFPVPHPGGLAYGNNILAISSFTGNFVYTHGPDKDARIFLCSTPWVNPGEGLAIRILSPADGAKTAADTLTVTGQVSESGAAVSVNSVPATVDGVYFTADIPLAEGSNTIIATATKGSNTGTASIHVTREPRLNVAITEPTDGRETTADSVAVSGTVSVDGATVSINGQQATVTGKTFSMDSLPLALGGNIITARANTAIQSAEQSIRVIRTGNEPFRVTITSPETGIGVGNAALTVTGSLNLPGATVTVNGSPATVVDTQFTASLTLADGENLIHADGVLGSQTSRDSIIVLLDRIPPEINFTGVQSGAALTATETTLTGTVTDNTDPNPTLSINGTPVLLTNNTFHYQINNLTDGSNSINCTAKDRFGNTSEVPLSLTVDTHAPDVTIDAPDFMFRTDNISVPVQAGDDVGVAGLRVLVNGSPVYDGSDSSTDIPLQVAPDAPFDTVNIRAEARDAAGNLGVAKAEIPVYERRYCYVNVFDDSTGHLISQPLQGENIRNKFHSKGAALKSEGNGRIGIITDSVGGALLSIRASGFTEVRRIVGIFEDHDRLFDARLTPLNPDPVTIGTDGGTVTLESGDTVEIPANTFTEDHAVRVTKISPQGLISFLPMGWSPVRALDISLDNDYTGTFSTSATVTLNGIQFLEPGDKLIAVEFDSDSNRWKSIGTPSVTDGTVSFPIPGAGRFALVVADRVNGPALPQTGEVLVGKGDTGELPTANARSWTDPEQTAVQEHVRAVGTIEIPDESPVSGLKIRAEFKQKIKRIGTGEEESGPVSEDLVLYSWPGRADMAPVISARFPVVPTGEISPATVLSGEITVTFLNREETGNARVVSPGYRWTFETRSGIRVVIPTGGVAGQGVVETKDSTTLIPDASGLNSDTPFTFTVEQTTLTKAPAVSTRWVPTAQGGTTMFCEVLSTATGTVLKFICPAAMQTDPESGVTRLTAAPDADHPGILTSGTYVFVHVAEPIGEIVGETTLDSTAVAGVEIRCAATPFGDVSAEDGSFRLTVPANREIQAIATDRNTNASATLTATVPAGETDTHDLELTRNSLTLLQSIPESGRLPSLTPEFELSFATPLESGQDLSNIVSLSNVEITATVEGTELKLHPDAALPADTDFTLLIKGGATGLKDVFGATLPADISISYKSPMAAGSVSFDFADIQLEQLPVQQGQPSTLRLSAEAGSLPVGTVVEMEDDITMAWFSDTVGDDGSLDHSFAGFPGDPIALTVTLPDGSVQSRTLTRCRLSQPSDGMTQFYVDTEGGTITGTGGIRLSIPRGALTHGIKLTLGMQDATAHTALEQKFPVPANDSLQSLASFKLISDRPVELRQPLTVKVPVEDDGTGKCYELVDFREGVTLPVLDPATGLPVLNGSGQITTATRNLRVIRGNAELVTVNEGGQPVTYLSARLGCARADGSFDGLSAFSECLRYTGGMDRLNQLSEIYGTFTDAASGDPLTGFVMLVPGGNVAPVVVPAKDGKFRFYYSDTGTNTKSVPSYIWGYSKMIGFQDILALCETGIGSLSGTSYNNDINHLLYNVYLHGYGSVDVNVQDTTPPTFDLAFKVLDRDGLPETDGQKQYDGTGIVPLDDTLRVIVKNLSDDRDSAPSVVVKANGTSVPVSRNGMNWVADVVNTPGNSGDVSISIAATDNSGNVSTQYKEAWFGVTGGQSLAGPPKVLPLAGYPADGAYEIPAILEADIFLSEPVSVAVTAANFRLKEIQGDSLVDPNPAINTYPEVRGETADGFTSAFHLQFSRPLKYETRYAIVVSGLVDQDGEKLDQDAVPGLVNGRDGHPETPAEIHFYTVAPQEGNLDSPANSLSDVQFFDGLAFCVTRRDPGDIFTPGMVEIYDLNHPGSIQSPVYAFETVAVPRAIAVRRYSHSVTDSDGNEQIQDGYLVAIMRKRTRDTNSTITLYEVWRNGSHFSHEKVGLTTHCLSCSRGSGASPSYSLEFRGDLLFAGIANGSIFTDPNTGQDTTPDSGIKIYSADSMCRVYDKLEPLDYRKIDLGSGIPLGLKDFVKTPGFCWDLDITDAPASDTPWAVVGDGSRFSEVLGVDLHEIREIPDNPADILPVDDRIKIRKLLTGKAPYMVEVREGFSYTDRSGSVPERKTISLAVLRANDMESGPNTVYLLDVTHPETGTYRVLGAIPFDNSERIGYVFADPVQNIIGASFSGGITRFYDITDPIHPEKLFETGTDGGNPPFFARGMYDGVAFGSNNSGLAVLNFSPDPFDYAGFRGVLPSQHRETVQKTSILPNLGVTVFTHTENHIVKPIDTYVYPRYQLHDRADVSIKAIEINEKGDPVGEEQTLTATRTVAPGQPVREQLHLSKLFGGVEEFTKAFGGNSAPRARFFRYTVEAKIPKTGQTFRKIGLFTLSPHIVARHVGDTVDHNIHTLTGNLIIDRTDLQLPAPELPLTIRRSYTSAGESGIGPAGAGWQFNIFPSLAWVEQNRYIISGGDFSSMTFIREGDSFTPEEGQGIHGSLTKDGDGLYTYKTKAGIKYHFKKVENLYAGTGTPSESEEIPYFIDPYNGSITNTAPNLDSIEGYGGNTIHYTYDADSGRLASITDITGREVKISYTYAGGAWRISDLSVTGSNYHVHYTYDTATGDLLSATRGGSGSASASASGTGKGASSSLSEHRTQKTEHISVTENYSYYSIEDNLPHNLKTLTDPAGNVTSYTYTKKSGDITLPDGRTQLKAEPVKTVSYPDGSTLSVTVNDDTPAVTTIISLGGGGATRQSTYQFNETHVLTSMSGPLGTTTYSDFDEDARDFRSISYPDGTEETRDFDNKGNRILDTRTRSTADQTTSVTETWAFDPNTNKITSHTAPAGTTTYQYVDGWKLRQKAFNDIAVQTISGWNRYGQPNSITNQYGETTSYQYDTYSNPTLISSDMLTSTRTYTLLGYVLSERDNRGKDITYTVDALGRIHKKTETEAGVGSRTTTYTLDGNGNITDESCAETAYHAIRTYDGLNRLTSETISPGNGSTDTLKHTGIRYDIYGNITSETLPNGASHTRAVDAAGRLTGETLGGTATRTVTYEPNSTRIHSDTDLVTGITKTTTYDIFDHTTSVSLSSPSGTLTRTFTYTPSGLLAAKVDINGVTTTYEYDSLNRPISVSSGTQTQPQTQTVVYQYDDSDHSTTVTNTRTGLVTTTRYNILNEPVHIEQTVDGKLRTSDITYTGTGSSLIRQTVNGNGTGLTEEISASGLPLSTTTAGGIKTTYRYAAGGLTATVTEHACGEGDIDRTRTIKKDALGRTIETTDGNGNTTTIEYDSTARTVTTNQPENRTIVQASDIFGRPVDKTINGTTVEHHDYETGSTRDTVTNRFGGTVTTETDPAGRTIKTTTFDGTTTSTTTTAYNGLTTTVTDPEQNITITTRDALYRPVEIKRPEGITTTITYNGNSTTTTDAKGQTTEITNEAGEPKQIKRDNVTIKTISLDYATRTLTETENANQPITTITKKDINGQIVSKTRGKITTTFINNRNGQPLTETLGGQGNEGTITRHYTYDGNGNLTAFDDGSGNIITYAYDGLNRKSAVIRPGNLKTEYHHNIYDELSEVKTAGGINNATYTYKDPTTIEKTFAGQTTTFALDGLGRQTAITRNDGRQISYTYTPDGNINTRTTYDSKTWTYNYDKANRLKEEKVNGQIRTYAYDPNSNLTEADTNNQHSKLKYNNWNQLISRQFENGKTVSYTYYSNGTIRTITDNLGQTTYYYYNESGLLSEVKDGSNQTLATYEYNTGTGKLHKINQMGNGNTVAVTELTYREGDGKLLEQNTTIGGQLAIKDSFEYDQRGNITKKEEKRGEKERTYTYTYYKDDLLKSYTTTENGRQIEQVEYEHDNAGNKIKETRSTDNKTITIENTFNDLNQLVSSKTTTKTTGAQPQTETQTVTYSYDDAGRLLTIQPIDGNSNPLPETHSYTYNEFGQLQAFNGPGGSATYTYSFDGKRISKYANGTLYDYTYHKNRLLEEYAANQGRINKYVIGLNNIGRVNYQGKYQPYILDMQRSVIGIISNGELQQAYSYAPYGKTDYTKNTNMPSTIQYLSRQYDTETGDYYLINRYYNADRGTFNEPDIFSNTNYSIPYSFNLYQYAFSNPLSYIDPDGDYPYKVRRGDSLWKIAKNTGIDLALLEQANINRAPSSDLIIEGQTLWIPEVRNPGDKFQQTIREGNREISLKEYIDANGNYFQSFTRTQYGSFRMTSDEIGFGDEVVRWLTSARDEFFEGKHGAYFSAVKAVISAYDEMKTLAKLKPLLEDDSNLVIKYGKSSSRLLKIGGKQGSKIRDVLDIEKLYNLRNMKPVEKLKLQKALGFIEEAKIPEELRYLRKGAAGLRFLDSWAVGAIVSPIANAIKYKAEGKDIMSTDYFVETGMDILKGAVAAGTTILVTGLAVSVVGIAAVPAAILGTVAGVGAAVYLDIKDNKFGVTAKAQEIFREGIRWWEEKLKPKPKPPMVPVLRPCPAGWHPKS